MRKISLAILGVVLILSISSLSSLVIGVAQCSPIRTIPPIVSTDWLYENLHLPGLIILDIRSPDQYNAGHIPGAINVPSYMWYTNPPFGEKSPWMEMPPQDYLFKLIGNSSMTRTSRVVVVGSTGGPLSPMPLALYNTATITRVAMTLLYAGLEDVAILDGGYEKWVADGYPIETVPNKPTLKIFLGAIKSEMIVSKEYVASKIGKAIIIDTRDHDVYLGLTQEPWTARPGHIPTARNLPTPCLWNIHVDKDTGEAAYVTYRSVEQLSALAECMIGANRLEEVIIYCGVGGYASTMYFILSEILGYKNIKVYDGSAQEWTSDLSLPVVYEGLGTDYPELQNLYTGLQKLYKSLSDMFSSLQKSYTTLEGNYISLKGEYDKLKEEYEKLKSKYDELVATTTPSYLTMIFVATTIIFLALSAYLAIRLRAAKK